MGFFRTSGVKEAIRHGVEESAQNPERGRSESRGGTRNSYTAGRRRSSTLSRHSSGRSVSASAKTIKCGSSQRTFGGSGNTVTTATGNTSTRSLSMIQSINRFRATYQSNRSISSKSFVSDLESGEMAVIGEGSNEAEMKRIAGLMPSNDNQIQDTDATSELFPSAEFSLANSASGRHSNANVSRHSGANNSNSNHDSSNHDLSSAELYETASIRSSNTVMMDKNRAENVGRSGTRLVYLAIFLSGLVFSVVTYLFMRHWEYREFKSEFMSYARETADLAETNADHTFSQLETMATTVTSEGLLERDRINQQAGAAFDGKNEDDHEDHEHRKLDHPTDLIPSWPNVTIPHFDQRIEDFSQAFGAVMLLYVPLVQEKDHDSWEKYANYYHPWRLEEVEEEEPHDHDNHLDSDKLAPSTNLGDHDDHDHGDHDDHGHSTQEDHGNYIYQSVYAQTEQELADLASNCICMNGSILCRDELGFVQCHCNDSGVVHCEADARHIEYEGVGGGHSDNGEHDHGDHGDHGMVNEDIDSEPWHKRNLQVRDLDSDSGLSTSAHDHVGHTHGSHHHGNQDGYMKIHACAHLNVNEIREEFLQVDDFADEVLREQGGFENPEGMTAPIYQYGGPGHERSKSSAIALMDLWTHPIFKKEVIASIEYDVPVITEYLDVGFLRDALSTPDAAGNVDPLWDSQYTVYNNKDAYDVSGASANLTLPHIRSLTLHPVKESFEENARTIGFVVGVVPWSTYFQNVYDDSDRNVDGIVVKIVSDCGSTFTTVLNSKSGSNEVRLGDWKEQYEEFEHLNHTSRFFYLEHPQGHSLHCHFDLHIYPNAEFREKYRSMQPLYYALAIAGIFLFTAIVFAFYDAFVFKGQRHIVSEATGMIVENARRAARNERELNDFIAHEVRNPLAAAISACAFVSSAMMEDDGKWSNNDNVSDTERLALIASDEKRKEVQGDIQIIDSSLHFINDLLRNMLDMQRAGSNQIHIDRKPTDIMNDIFRPVEAMMHLRDVPFKVILEVNGIQDSTDEDGDQLVIMTDPMRLKQVMLNLTRNATKFVEEGFIRCSAYINPINGCVELCVDDSGPGIPPEKRSQVFGKFQQSLDLLQQGTGIGLSLCKKMIDLMGGCLFIDEDYHSGIDGCPGTRFVIQLKTPPMQVNEMVFEPSLSSQDRARMKRRHLLANTENRSETPETANQSDSASSSSVSSNSKEIRIEPLVIGNKTIETPTAKPTEDEKQESILIPIPTTVEPTPTKPTEDAIAIDLPNVIEDCKEEPQKLEKPLLTELPENLSILFVDDDMVLRKLFSRTLRKINPTWKCKEASSGETAIELITSQSDCKEGFKDEDVNENVEADCGFDLIFMDQYMASVQKQLLGTETVRAIRAKGFQKPIICGLSANDVEDAFYQAGSDAFMFKPFPCKKDELEKELLKVMNSRVRRR